MLKSVNRNQRYCKNKSGPFLGGGGSVKYLVLVLTKYLWLFTVHDESKNPSTVIPGTWAGGRSISVETFASSCWLTETNLFALRQTLRA